MERQVEVYIIKETNSIEVTPVTEIREVEVHRDKGNDGEPGAIGLSAYEVAVANDFIGTEAEWLLSLKGDKGDNGDAGDPGADGKSAYQSYLDTTTDDPVMTEAQWSNQLGDIATLLAAL